MPGKIVPLYYGVKLVNPDGSPTDWFTRWAQEKQIDIQNSITLAQAQQAIDDWAAQRYVKTPKGSGLTGGGNLSADLTLAIANTAVNPGTVGDETHVAQITVNQQGQITNIKSVTIATLPDAPNDGKYYCRQNDAWVAFTPTLVS